MASFYKARLMICYLCLFRTEKVPTTMENSMGQIVPMTSLALSQSMDSVNTATNEEEVSPLTLSSFYESQNQWIRI